ncbi:glycosyltransferase family 2 protein [Fulvivirga lutea]|uniref:Glycosyltransferase family 2 protein n=1 Tax=Fulvivirga lutea TaxID=2810512 RepID=A0A974ZZV3_9BACT|nr:glycosyltransferase family 2 protein [Fulvivirga lutea]QSE96561.1 glycosyltransferase family 2 protein [Fulvivirga lutea]
MSNLYFDRYAYKKHIIAQRPSENLGLVITIPCFNEPHLLKSLASIAYCHPGRADVEVIVVINHSFDASDSIKQHNQKTFEEALQFAETYNTDHLKFYILLEELPAKHAGVGLARKIAMDEAAYRLSSINKDDGIIVCYDADSQCDDNYLLELERYFTQHKDCPGCSIYFEHTLEGEFEDKVYEAIVDYELFLRYYVHALRYAGFPFAHQTIGSSMAVRNAVYQRQGGMNRRKAGEDFYFLHKIIPLGNFGELNTTRVIPSPRKSDRVPFGTGKAVNDWLNRGNLDTYNFKSFEDLRNFYTKLNLVVDYNSLIYNWLESIPESLIEFGKTIDLTENIERIKKNSSNLDSFKSNFHRWFDGFMVLKFVHFARDHYYPNYPISKAVEELFMVNNWKIEESNKANLLALRTIDRST